MYPLVVSRFGGKGKGEGQASRQGKDSHQKRARQEAGDQEGVGEEAHPREEGRQEIAHAES